MACSTAVSLKPRASRLGVCQHVLHCALTFGDSSQFQRGGWGHTLVGAGLQELAYPHPAGIARGPASRKNVIGPNGLIAVGDGGLLPDKQRTVVAEVGEELVSVRCMKLQVFGRIIVA